MTRYNEGGNFFAFREELEGEIRTDHLRATTSASVILWFALSDRLALINNDKRSRPPRLSLFSPVPKAAALLSSSSPWPVISRFFAYLRDSRSRLGCWAVSMKAESSFQLTITRRAGMKIFSRFKLKVRKRGPRARNVSCSSLDCALAVGLSASKARLNPIGGYES